MPLFGPPNVEKLKAKGNVKGLIKALGYKKDANIRQAAANALGQIGAPAVEPLIAALKDGHRPMRIAAALVLVALYTSGSLDDAHKRTILALRDTITRTGKHSDYCAENRCGTTVHVDQSAESVDFTL